MPTSTINAAKKKLNKIYAFSFHLCEPVLFAAMGAAGSSMVDAMAHPGTVSVGFALAACGLHSKSNGTYLSGSAILLVSGISNIVRARWHVEAERKRINQRREDLLWQEHNLMQREMQVRRDEERLVVREFIVAASEAALIGPRSPTHAIDEKDQPTDITELQCCVCKNNRCRAVLLPCGHANLCLSCAVKVGLKHNRCPMCRSHITQIVRTFP